jgi:hypothetical protein|tara:strand:- start:2465 stop:2944 length:480 start_codon:yes stop_codon:yes gene_type:complete
MPDLNEKFEKALATFIRSTKTSMSSAHACACYAIENFAKGNNPVLAQRFLDAMPKNYIRRAAFVKWLAAHSPVTIVDKKLAYVKDSKVKFDVKGAKSKKFWEYAPDMEDVIFTDEGLKADLVKLVKRYERDNYVPENDNAKNLLAEVKATVGNLKVKAA